MEQGRREMKPPPQQPQQPPENQLQSLQGQPPPPPQKCPRCDSLNTKFCYYNNYSLSQPRYFCKGCRRYWTQGGTLRNVPVGGGCRKAKRVKTSSSSGGNITKTQIQTQPAVPVGAAQYYPSGGFLSSLAALNSLGQPQATYGSSSPGFSLFHGFNLPSLTPQQQPQSQTQLEFYQMANQGLVQPNRPLGFWNQTLHDDDNNNVSDARLDPNVGTSLNPNLMTYFPGYGPSSS